jgi:PAS domain-containing protein
VTHGTVLVVEDHPLNRELVVDLLEAAGCAEYLTKPLDTQALLPGVHTVPTSIAGASILVVLSAPFLWWFVVRPLRSVAVTEHEQAATVIEHAADGIITVDEQGLVVSFNPAAEAIFGHSAEEILGEPRFPAGGAQ